MKKTEKRTLVNVYQQFIEFFENKKFYANDVRSPFLKEEEIYFNTDEEVLNFFVNFNEKEKDIDILRIFARNIFLSEKIHRYISNFKKENKEYKQNILDSNQKLTKEIIDLKKTFENILTVFDVKIENLENSLKEIKNKID